MLTEQSVDDEYPAHPRSSMTAVCDATDLVTDVHWNPVQRFNVYSTNASTSKYAQKTLSIDGETCCRYQLTKHASPMTDADWRNRWFIAGERELSNACDWAASVNVCSTATRLHVDWLSRALVMWASCIKVCIHCTFPLKLVELPASERNLLVELSAMGLRMASRVAHTAS